MIFDKVISCLQESPPELCKYFHGCERLIPHQGQNVRRESTRQIWPKPRLQVLAFLDCFLNEGLRFNSECVFQYLLENRANLS